MGTNESQTLDYAENDHAAGCALLLMVNGIMDFSGTVEYSSSSFTQDIMIHTECIAKERGSDV